MYGEQNNLDVSIKASIFEDILKRVPASFDKVGIEFNNLEGEYKEPMGNVRIRVKTDDSNKQLVLTKNAPMDIKSPGYLLVDVTWFRQIMGKFGDNLRIQWNLGEQILLEDENGSATKTPFIIEDVNVVDVKKIFPYQDGRIFYPQREGNGIVKDENGKPIMKPADSFATIPLEDMKRALQDAIWSKHDYISMHLVPGSSTSVSGKYDAKGTKSSSKINADVGGSGDIDLPKSIDEFVKTISSKDGKIGIHFSDNFPVATMVYEEENEQIFYTLVKMNRPKPGDE